ncbi:MAG: cation diffusion facilitator family transporter [Desulforhopalus sp.]|nr:cation diffusion facilitator family transporter [Desulforhopalus sp.]
MANDQSEKIGLFSVGINSSLVLIKVILAYLSGSVALVADAIHSLSDVISSATVLAGIKISKRKSTRFPYGLYKVENLVCLLSSIFIFFAGYEIVQTVLFKEESLKPEFLPDAMAGALVTMAITFFFSRYELREGERIGSPSLIADAQHIRTDMFSSAVILCGLVGGLFHWPLDKVAALVVVVLVFRAGFTIFLDAIRVLLDASLDFESMDKVKTAILSHPQVTSIHSLRGRNSGRFKFIEADIGLRVRELERAHHVSQQIEAEISKSVPNVDRVLIHYEPEKKETRVCAIPLQEDKMSLSEHFGEAPYYYIVQMRERDRSIIEERILTNPFKDEEKGKGLKVSKWLLQQDVDTVINSKSLAGKGPGYVLSDADVNIVISKGNRLGDVLKEVGIEDEKVPG